jgi:hypothetical protein
MEGGHVSLVAVVAMTSGAPLPDAALAKLAQGVGALRHEEVCEVVTSPRVAAARLAPATGADARHRRKRPQPGQSWSLSTDRFSLTGPDEVVAAWQRQLAVVGYDAGRDDVVIGTDGLGLMPVYVCQVADAMLVSTSAMAIARVARPRVDAVGLRTFLATGMRIGPRTMWEGVRRLDPGTQLAVDPCGRQRVRTHWRADVQPELWSQPLGLAAERVTAAALQDVSNLAARSSMVSDLTGGYDSRLVCLLLAQVGARFATTTRSVRDRVDVDTARSIAGSKGWPWLHTPLPADWARMLPERLGSALGAGDGALDVLQLARVLEPRAQLRRSFADVVSGGGGEHLQYAGWKSELGTVGATGEPHISRWVRMRLLTKGLAGLPRSDVDDVVSYLTEALTEWTEAWRGLPRAVQLDAVYAYVKATAHFGAYRSADATLLRAHLPLYGRATYEAAFTTHYRWRNGHRLMREMMVRLDPVIAAVPTTRGGPAVPMSLRKAHLFAPYFVQLARKGVAKVSGELRSGRPRQHGVGEFHWLHEANAHLAPALAELTQARPSRLFDDGGLDRDAVLDALRANAPDPYGRAVLVGRLLTADLALKDADA